MNPVLRTTLRRSEPRLTGLRLAVFIVASLLLVAVVLALGSAVSQAGAEERFRRNICLLLIAGLGLAVSFLRPNRAERALPLDRVISLCAATLPCYALLQ